MTNMRRCLMTALVAILVSGTAAAQDAFFIDPNGDIGIGTETPLMPVHLVRDDGSAQVLVENTNADAGPQNLFWGKSDGPTKFILENTLADTWIMNAAPNGYRITANFQPFTVSLFTTDGDLFMGRDVHAAQDVIATRNAIAQQFIGPAFLQSSSRMEKADIEPVDPLEVLDLVVRTPVSRWRFQKEPAAIRHMGPMAEDFRASFGLGADDRYISTVDTAGVALAAIQGLHEMVEAQREELERKDEAIAALEARLAALEASVRPSNVSTAETAIEPVDVAEGRNQETNSRMAGR